MTIYDLILKGGIHYDLKGKTIRETLKSLTDALPRQEYLDTDELLKALLEREDLISTGIGNGIAIPHPRNPLIKNPEDQFVAIGFLEKPVDWNTLNRSPVDTLFLIVSSSPKNHLETLSKISYFCREEGFRDLIKNRVTAEEIKNYIKTAEESWE